MTLVGRQEPTFLWVPDHDETLGTEVIELAATAGLNLDPWQQLLVRYACSLDPAGFWLCFEVAVIVSRQNGKGGFLEAMELAWLFLFGDKLIIHSAHLFETSREHFLRMQTLITNHDDFRRRVRRMREGRGAEEIELIGSGQRLKFMTRKGGAGRGFTGNKVVLDEAMYLDAMMMAASLPTLATVQNAQVIYTGSAGMKHSTQLASVRRRGFARDDPALMLAAWEAEPAVYERGRLVAGDDPAAPQTWAKVNPGYAIRISAGYIRKEMAALGGPNSREFGTERLGIGDWPDEDEAWEVIDQVSWQRCADAGSQVPDGAVIALAIDADPQRAMGTIGVCGLRADGRRHVEVIERHRGTGWILGATTAATASTPAAAAGEELSEWEQQIVASMVAKVARYRVCAVVVLKTSTAASLINALVRAGLPVQSPSEIEYAQACGSFYEGVGEKDSVRHLDQPSVNAAVGGARKRSSAEGSWRWSREAPADAAPVVVDTLSMWGLENFAGRLSEPWVFDSTELSRPLVPVDAVVDRGSAGFATVMRASRGR